MDTIKFNLKNNTVHEMDVSELARWACLLEGIEFISKRSGELGIGDDNLDWIKPIALQKYIDERFEAMKHDLTVEKMLGRL
jgi:hypothetical protein